MEPAVPGLLGAIDDEATIVLEYPKAQGIIQASWNWPFNRKDFEIYGEHGYAVATGTTSQPIYLDFAGEKILASVEWVELTISEFVHIAGSFAFEKGPTATVDVTGGLVTGAASDYLDQLNLPNNISIPATGADTTQLSFMTLGASDVHAFVGLHGPYWTDLDGDHQISWTDDAGNELTAAVADANHNGKVDVGETAELNGDATGLVIDDFDFGMAIMRPTNPADFAKYFALKATANEITLVGMQGVTVKAENLLVELNQSSPSVYGVPLFPVVDFAGTYGVDEQKTLFDVFDADHNHQVTDAELTVALGPHTPITQPLTMAEELVKVLNAGGAPPGVLTVEEVVGQLTTTFKNAIASGQSQTNMARIKAADADGDGKFDPIGYEGAYTGHDEPSLLFYSNTPGSGKPSKAISGER